MHDLTGKNFNSNSPMKNYIKLNERIDEMQTRIRDSKYKYLEVIKKVNY